MRNIFSLKIFGEFYLTSKIRFWGYRRRLGQINTTIHKNDQLNNSTIIASSEFWNDENSSSLFIEVK
jgi:hypothetical protein